jgi:cell division septum initiation protein DivIVA
MGEKKRLRQEVADLVEALDYTSGIVSEKNVQIRAMAAQIDRLVLLVAEQNHAIVQERGSVLFARRVIALTEARVFDLMGDRVTADARRRHAAELAERAERGSS